MGKGLVGKFFLHYNYGITRTARWQVELAPEYLQQTQLTNGWSDVFAYALFRVPIPPFVKSLAQ